MTPLDDPDAPALTRRERRRRSAGIAPSFSDAAASTDSAAAGAGAAASTGSAAVSDASTADASGADASAQDAAGSDAGLETDAVTEVATAGDASEAVTTEVAATSTADADADVSAGADSEADAVDHEADAGSEADAVTAEDAVMAEVLGAEASDAEPAARWADDESPATALTWVEPGAVAAGTGPATFGGEAEADPQPDLLADAPRRGPRPGLLIPIGAVVLLVAAYSATALMWPLHELPPTVEAVEVTPDPADPAELTWPAKGSAAISVDGVGVASSSPNASLIASVTKVVSVMLVLDELPLKPGEEGPSYSFSYRDSREYWSYLRDNQSALDVPVGGSLTEHQMLQGILLGSANNYIDHLADEIWGSEAEFAAAARLWLHSRGLDDITIESPSGRDSDNVATPEALTKLADIAMADPVFAEIVATPSVELPGAGTVHNSNGLLGEPGIVGIKTGTLDHQYNLLSGKDVTVGDTTVRLYAAVLGQDGNDARLDASRTLYTEVEAALQAQGPAVDAGTVVGEVSTPWGEQIDVVTDADANVVLWNSATATADVVFDLGDQVEAGDDVGTLMVDGPIDGVEIAVSLADDIEGPTWWWRLTHPLELFGISG